MSFSNGKSRSVIYLLPSNSAHREEKALANLREPPYLWVGFAASRLSDVDIANLKWFIMMGDVTSFVSEGFGADF